MRKTKYKGPLSLAHDFRYSAPYTVDSRVEEPLVYPPETHPFIHAYNDVAEARKNRFLKDASHYLWTVGQELLPYGFEPAAVITSPAGIAVSGDVWIEYRHPEHDRSIYLHISECGVDILGEAPPIGAPPTTRAFTTRRDCISIMGRWREAPPAGMRGDPKNWRSMKEGPNTWFDANLNSRELAEQILPFLSLIPLVSKELVQTSLFDQLQSAA